MLVYGYLLLQGANLLSDGSELLLEVLSPGLIGGLLLPVLGALPDALVIAVSGLGAPAGEAQEQVRFSFFCRALLSDFNFLITLHILLSASMNLSASKQGCRDWSSDSRVVCSLEFADVGLQVAVGVGTLAGSTIMLLTITWAGSLLCARCDLNEQVLVCVALHSKSSIHRLQAYQSCCDCPAFQIYHAPPLSLSELL